MLKKLLLLLSLCFFCVLPAGICSAEATYPITESALTRLDQIFDQLAINNNQLLTELQMSNQDLETAQRQLEEYQTKLMQSQKELEELKAQLLTLKAESTQAKTSLQAVQTSLQKANESLNKYEKEVQSRETKLKIERDIGWVVAAIAIFHK
ncbi:MAG: hypothetical protein ABFC84_02560 [Veillonellales bacterium]